jgi:Flp pilus assembly protein TadG
VTNPLTRRFHLRRSSKGQSLVEMALILPFMLAFAGGATDFARAYAASIALESSVRSAAEYVASDTTILTQADALTVATKVVCLESQDTAGFTPGTGPKPEETCTAPAVTVPSFSVSATAPGASAANPIGTVHVRAELDFQTLIPYPFLPTGGWTLSADSTYSVMRGR